MEFLLIYTIGIILTSGFVTWIFTARHAGKKGFDSGYNTGHKDAFRQMREANAMVQRLKSKAEQRRYEVLTAEIIGSEQ